MIHLRSIDIRTFQTEDDSGFPYHIPIIRNLESLEFSTPVTFLVGDNGSGKSTLLEAIACAVESITVGSESVKYDKTLDAVRGYSRQMKLTWNKRTRKGFFLRAEDFFGYAKKLAQLKAELDQDLQRVESEYQNRSRFASDLAKSAYVNELGEIQRRYGDGLDNASHGESFLALFQARFVPGGLYLLDEPEAPLSPLRQLGFLSLLKDMVDQDAQFIIATHSPIIMAFPGATILSFDFQNLPAINYQDLEQVNLVRDFLLNPEAYLRHI